MNVPNNHNMKIMDLTPENIADYGVCGYKDTGKHKELRDKIAWFSEYYPKGLRIKAAIADDGSYQGMLEYLPGRYAHRPVNAEGYMFIHCVFVGFRSGHKGKGYASALLEECISEARLQQMSGVAVVTRKGAFMADSGIFLKQGFESVDRALPDFELLALRFDKASIPPSFKEDMQIRLEDYTNGLTIIRSPQCPYTGKNVVAIMETASEKFGLQAKLVDLPDAESAQKTPCAFGTFCIVYNGSIISHHPISNTRFENIMNKIVK